MPNIKKLKIKQGDDFSLNFTLTDTLNETAVNAKAALELSKVNLISLRKVDPQDPVAISDAETVITNNEAAYALAIIVDITDWVITSQLRWCGKLFDTFIVTIPEPLTGKFTISRDGSFTSLWIPRKYVTDVQFTTTSGKISSETFSVEVERDITNV
jgi:hypothetical protein